MILWRIIHRKRTWTDRRAERVRPLEFAPLSDRGRTAVRPKSDETRRVSTWRPRGWWVWMERIRDWSGWRWRWRHCIDCPAHAAPRGSLKITLSLFTLFLSLNPFLYPLACRSAGLGKDYLQDMQKREREREEDSSANLSSLCCFVDKQSLPTIKK